MLPKFTAIVFILLGTLGIFSPFLSNNRPIWCKLDGVSHWPAWESIWDKGINARYMALDENNQWLQLPEKWMPPIPFNAVNTSPEKNKPPMSKSNGGTHLLGTDALGRDVMAGLISGTRTALITGLIALLVSFSLGGLLGGLAGYVGDDRLRVRKASVSLFLLLGTVVLYLMLGSRKSQLNLVQWPETLGILAIGILLYGMFSWICKKLGWGQSSWLLPMDTLIMRFAEVLESIPSLILILLCVSFLENRTLTNVILLIGLLSWTGVARFLRAELLKVRQTGYIAAVRRLGFPEWRILLRHAIPNAKRPVLLLLVLSASGAILIESSLSFLNLSSDDSTLVTWGKMLQASRDNIEFWWAWLPPGILITLISAAMFEVLD